MSRTTPSVTKRSTSQQVAKRAGVSRSTVSLILNNAPGMKFAERTRARVLQAALELGYVPDAAARTLASGRTGTVGLIVNHAEHLLVDAFIPQVLYSLIKVSRERGFRTLVETPEDVSQPDVYIELVRAKQIDGLVVINPRPHDEGLRQLNQEGFPLVTLGKLREAGGYKAPPNHSVSHRTGVREAVRHLINLGHRRIAHITFAPLGYGSSDRRLESYRRTLLMADLLADPALVRRGNHSAASGFAAMRSLLAERPYPTALFAGNDTIALGALAALHQRGLRIPEDMAVVGYDDIPTAAYTAPPLTTVRAPATEQGRLAGEMVLDLIEGRPVPNPRLLLDTELIVRDSCGARRAAYSGEKGHNV
ncbi:MAG: LacI family DNA-binding transcriptional regulator [Truepera sp.]|nr:LacI family DNA-binding transcriptional regulator [Truepera sp.]